MQAVAHGHHVVGADVDALAQRDELAAAVLDLPAEPEDLAELAFDAVGALLESRKALDEARLDGQEPPGRLGDRVEVVEGAQREPRRQEKRVHRARKIPCG